MSENYRISHNKEYDTKPIQFHSHDFYEIYFFVDGKVTYYIENESYTLTKGDVLIIPPRKLHRPVIEKDIPYERYVLWIYGHYVSSNDGLRSMIDEIMHLISEKNTRLVSFGGSILQEMKALFAGLISDFSSENYRAIYTAQSRMILILEEILKSLQQMQKVENETMDVIRQVISYINENVANAPSLEELSTLFFVSKYYLLHRFKEYTKTTIHQYILMKKINLAKELLDKGNTPKKVSELCGFSNYSNFYKAFTSQTGMAPKDW